MKDQKFLRSSFVIFSIFLSSESAYCQDINFKDLGRIGAPVVKKYVVEGVEADGREYLSKFDGVDTDRINEARKTRSGYGNSSSGTIEFSCKIECAGSWWASGGVSKYDVLASSSDEAQRLIEKKELCKSSRGRDALGGVVSTNLAKIFCSPK